MITRIRESRLRRTLRADFCDFGRAEALRKAKLNLIGHILAAKHQNGMFLEGGPHRRIGGIIGGYIRKRDAAQFGGESWTQRDNVHRQALPVFKPFSAGWR